ncbi:MAG: phosphoenolpyruvate carboxykinase (ATP) [Nitrospinae bacterium]|nr:phosphoenolpyruvate carboxykinase (ATP) [Nitrospinota bacterium]
MENVGVNPKDLLVHGIKKASTVYWNLSTASLYEKIVDNNEGHIAHGGALVVRTGYYTGRAPNDKFIIKEPSSEHDVWWGKVNKPLAEDKFDALYNRVMVYLMGRDLYVQEVLAGADPEFEFPIRIITQDAWHSLFARNLFIRPVNLGRPMEKVAPEFTVIHAPHFHAMPSQDGTNSEAFILLNLRKKTVLIGGTSYAGEIKKSIFSALNYLLPKKGILSMHASANMGKSGDVAIFFGLSGTGKTTLSADPERRLIGDDEHGWSGRGVFNFEGGCYAKVINLSREKEPQIYNASRKFATILENVGLDMSTRRVDLDDNSLTENTRAAYPITHIDNVIYPGVGGHPKNIIMLTCDAFGVLPPVAKLSTNQAMYHFISGYTAKVAGTEKGMGKEPQATFSTCFGAPFMALHPSVYAKLLGEKIARHKVDCWLVNTGWTGGPYGVGKRMDINDTRSIIRAALDGSLGKAETKTDKIFGLRVPLSCPGVMKKVLRPESTWEDRGAYQAKARELARKFKENIAHYADKTSKEILEAGPNPE